MQDAAIDTSMIENGAVSGPGGQQQTQEGLEAAEILRGMSLLELAKFARKRKQNKDDAEDAFCSGARHIKIDDTQRVADTKMILLQFGHLARSISVDGAGKKFDILDVLSSVGSTVQGTSKLKILELSSFYLDSLSLTFDKQESVFNLLFKLKEISLIDCGISNFGHLFLTIASSLKRIG